MANSDLNFDDYNVGLFLIVEDNNISYNDQAMQNSPLLEFPAEGAAAVNDGDTSRGDAAQKRGRKRHHDQWQHKKQSKLYNEGH